MAVAVLAMSGGVDSSAAAKLLLDAGHEVIGVFMRHGAESPLAECQTQNTNSLPIIRPRLDHKQGCCSATDAEDARQVAQQLGIPFYALNLQQEFDQIIDYFVDSYRQGRTPNPCVMCNNWIKFGKLFAYANSVGADFVATGHYARLTQSDDGQFLLRRGLDAKKDQSYVLFGIAKQFLPRVLLPVGEYRKPEIRQMAEATGLRVAAKKDSQEICFVTTGDHGAFVRERSNEATAGEIVTTDGRVVGSHPGIENYTIGQRRGLGVAMGEPYYVVRIEHVARQVVIGKYEQLARSSLTASNANWLFPLRESRRCLAQIRYNSQPVPAVVTPQQANGDKFEVVFDQPCYGVAPGQAVVCYEDDVVLGGGWIDSTVTSE